MSERQFRGSNLVAAGILLSRIAGTLRTVVLGVVLGSDQLVTDAFGMAMRIPNLLQNLLGEGSLSASFIPVYARLVEQGDERRASALAGAVVSLLTLATSVLVVIGVAGAGPLIRIFTSWETNPPLFDLAVDLTRITTIGLGFMVISAWCLGVLNSHRSFFLSYVAPVVWNMTQVVALIAGALLVWSNREIVIVLAWAMVAGSILQVLVQIPRVARYAPGLRFNLTKTAELRTVLRRFGPAVGGRGVLQLSSFADTLLAGALTVGAMSWYVYAMPLYITPISLFGFSVAASELAEMSRTSNSLEQISARLQPALQRVVVPAGFITAAYLTTSPLLVDALYGWLSRLAGRGLSDPGTILTIAYVTAAFAIGLPAAMTSRVNQNTLYSMGDVRGPARISTVRLLVGVTMSAILMLQFDWLSFVNGDLVRLGPVPHWPPWERVPEAIRNAPDGPHLGVVGLALGTSAGAWTEWILLRRRLSQRLGGTITSGATTGVLAASVASAVVMVVARWFAGQISIPSPIDAIAVIAAGAGAYLSILSSQGIDVRRLR